MNNQIFFDRIRGPVFDGALTQSQVEGCLLLLSAFRDAKWPLAWAAYGFATAYHETGATMQPIAEYGDNARFTRFTRLYDIQGRDPERARNHGNTKPGDGIKYRGRGFVQLTWKDNYRKASRAVGLDLVAEPDLAMRPNIAIAITVDGMATGMFTGKKNADFLNSNPPNYYAARRIINGTDKAATIALLAEKFEAALKAAGYAPSPVVAPAPAPPGPAIPVLDAVKPAPPPMRPVSTPPPKPSLWARMKGLLA
jgi:putative chitinase